MHAPFWAAAARRELVVQRCRTCGRHQFYARPFCLGCQGTALEWAPVSGRGTVHSLTVVHRQASPDLPVPYVNALVDLDEGPRLLTLLVGGPCRIGDRVRVAWRERAGAPPLPVFEPAEGPRPAAPAGPAA
jgi:uncharacterized OB-fold protein